jgi:hypothetical protein
VLQIERRGMPVPPKLLPALLADARTGLDHLLGQSIWRMPADRRLAFRELGLAIGLQALERLDAAIPGDDPRGLTDLIRPLVEQRTLADRLVEFWLQPRHRQVATWTDHQDINDVMLATALAPAGYVQLGQ